MELPPRLGMVLSVIQLLLLMTCGADHVNLPAAVLATSTNRTSSQEYLVRDCSDLGYGSPSGVYEIYPDLQTATLAYCDMDDGEGWTVFQRRADITPRQDFWKDWESYKWGLGSFEGEFWWGLQHLWQLTMQLDRVYEMRVDLWDWEYETRYAIYQHFTIASEEDGYRLDYDLYAGDAGDALDYHKGFEFTTIDRDHDDWYDNCAVKYKGAWWYKSCHYSNLNGLYSPEISNGSTVEWSTWKDYYSLNATTMKMRPTVKLYSG